jgi:hypothetical protein
VCWGSETACPLLEAYPEIREDLRELRVKRKEQEWRRQEQELKKEYPDFDLSETARQSELFCALLVRTGNVREAYLKYEEERKHVS